MSLGVSSRNISKEQHREFREKERDRERDDRFSRSCKINMACGLNFLKYLIVFF